ncbi:MAG: hypothetical protein JKY25_10470 [Robiginitomaculum sp.]|nr:hypothetical protein [Robiginitomaculum sp.]
MNIKHLIGLVDKLYSDKLRLDLLRQEIAENFYPQRADFTRTRIMGEEFSDNLSTSYTILIRRELADQIGSMLRPETKQWFKAGIKFSDKVDNESKRFLEFTEKTQRKIMYDPVAMLAQVAKQADNDFAAFGEAVLSVRLNKNRDALLYRSWHLRDVVWSENEEGQHAIVARKWKPTNRDLVTIFGDKVSARVSDRVDKHPFERVDCLHIEVESNIYDIKSGKMQFVSIYYDRQNSHLIEETATRRREYIIPQWEKPCDSQYAYSPSTITALADARMIQAMTYTLLEAGEKSTNPPLIATKGAVSGDIAIYAGGISWLNEEYDERLGSALRPIPQDYSGIPNGMEMIRDARDLLAQAFYLNKLTLPVNNGDMTAYEVSKRVDEYIRGALPLFAPMEPSYNGRLCSATFDLLIDNGAFGADIPESLQGREIEFTFESPLHDSIEAQKSQIFIQSGELIRAAAELDPGALAVPDTINGLRDALASLGAPASWVNSRETVEQKVKEQQQKIERQEALDQIEQGVKVVG